MNIITILVCKYIDKTYVQLSDCLEEEERFNFHFFFLQGALVNQAASQTNGELLIMRRRVEFSM